MDVLLSSLLVVAVMYKFEKIHKFLEFENGSDEDYEM